MAQSKCFPVFGSRPPFAYESRFAEHTAQAERSGTINTPYLYDRQPSRTSLSSVVNSSYNFVDYLRNREYGMRGYKSLNKDYVTRRMLTDKLIKECPIKVEMADTIMCSEWISDNEITYGTKCNKLMVYDITSRNLKEIQIRKFTDDSESRDIGINNLKISPSRSLLASTGVLKDEVIVYKLPSFEPAVLKENTDNYLVVDIDWIDEEYLISVSKETKVGIWQVRDTCDEQIVPNACLKEDYLEKTSYHSLTFNKHLNHIAALSLNGRVSFIDVTKLSETFSEQISFPLNCFSITKNSDYGLYAVGCRKHIVLIDPKTLKLKEIAAKYDGYVIKSISFRDNIITIGTSNGELLIFDIRAEKYLDKFKSKPINKKFEHPICTHCYDHSGTRLFTAGGPSGWNSIGSFASVWL